MSDSGLERVRLADWRRRVAELYAEIRRMAASDPAAAHVHWRTVREALYREHPASPVPVERRSEFRAIHFPYNPRLRFELPVMPDSAPEATSAEGAIAVSTGALLRFDRVGWLDVPFEAGQRRLALFWLPEYSGGLFLPFRDATNGHETYGGGRYLLDTAKGADLGESRLLGSDGRDGDGRDGGVGRAQIVIDFNFAYQPSCAFDPRWSCPLAPAENRLDLELAAGERIG
jgi:uncharacterized protein